MILTRIDTGNLHVRAAVLTALAAAAAFTEPSSSAAGQVVEIGDPIVTIGQFDGPPELTFDYITHLDVDFEGNIFVIDRSRDNIRWFDRSGDYMGTIGRDGAGPGEFRRAWAMAIGSDRKLHVLDYGNARISVFSRTAEGYVFERASRLLPNADAICAVGTRRYVLTPGHPKIIQEIDTAGQVVASFGQALEYRGSNRSRFSPPGLAEARLTVNRGQLVCDSALRLVVHLSMIGGTVRAFSADGELVWQTELEDLAGDYLGHNPRMGNLCCLFTWDPEVGVQEAPAAGAFSSDGTLLVSIYRTTRADPYSHEYWVRALDADTGSELRRYRVPGPVWGAIGHSPVVVVQEPIPQIAIYPH